MEKNENCYCIYMHENKINGKKYIGKTRNKPQQRWGRGTGYWENEDFSRDIEEYGWDNFEHIILHENLSSEQAKIMENKLIKQYNTINPDIGYNKRLEECFLIDEESEIKCCDKYTIKDTMEKAHFVLKIPENTKKRILGGKYITPNMHNLETTMGAICYMHNKSQFYDIGVRWFNLPSGVFYWYECFGGSVIQLLGKRIGNSFYDKGLTERQIKNIVDKNIKQVNEILEKSKDTLELYKEALKIYYEHKKELSHFCIENITVGYVYGYDKPTVIIKFPPHILSGYIIGFLGIESYGYYRSNGLEILKRLCKRGTYDNFVNWLESNNWVVTFDAYRSCLVN